MHAARWSDMSVVYDTVPLIAPSPLWSPTSPAHLCELRGDAIFSVLRSLHPVVQGGCTGLHSHRQCTELPFPHVLAYLRDDACPDRRAGTSRRALICVSPAIPDVEPPSLVLSLALSRA